MESDATPYAASQRLTLPADALVLTVVAGAALVIVKDLLNVPAPWLDSMHAFLITMTLSAVVGATVSWSIHRRRAGRAGWAAVAGGLAAAVAAVLLAENAISSATALSAAATGLAFTAYQAAGAASVAALLIACIVELSHMVDPQRRAIAIVRIAGLATIGALIVFRFIPETQADPLAAQIYAILGLTTVTGAVGVAIGDAALRALGRREGRIGAHPPAPPVNAC